MNREETKLLAWLDSQAAQVDELTPEEEAKLEDFVAQEFQVVRFFPVEQFYGI